MVALTIKQLYIITFSILGLIVAIVFTWIAWKRWRNKYIEFVFKNKFIRAVIIRRNKQIIISSNPIQNNKFTWGNKTYIVDSKSILYKKHFPYGFYMEGDPNPLMFKDKKIEVDSSTLKQMLETKVLRDLFHDPKEFNWLMIAIGINVVITIIIGLKVFNIGFK